MRKLTFLLTVLAASAPLPALAQDVPADETLEQSAADLSATLADRETQERLAQSVATMSEALLDLPVAPFLRAAAQMAGEDPEAVDPDLTLRQMSPEAGRVPGEVADKLPQMMGAMAGIADGMAAMMPALRDMARRMEHAARGVDLPEG